MSHAVHLMPDPHREQRTANIIAHAYLELWDILGMRDATCCPLSRCAALGENRAYVLRNVYKSKCYNIPSR